VIDARIPSAGEPTIYAMLGDFVLMALVLVAVSLVLVLMRIHRRASGRQEP
jgi:apolipoprotein N-acyltransferase